MLKRCYLLRKQLTYTRYQKQRCIGRGDQALYGVSEQRPTYEEEESVIINYNGWYIFS